jgi:thiamine biosynthesis lipoprotein
MSRRASIPVLLSVEAMGTRFELVLHGADAVRLRAAGEEALREIERLERLLSCYRADSEITGVNHGAAREPVRVSAEVFRLLEACADVTGRTEGAFDVTIAPLMRVWRLAGDRGAMADAGAVEAACNVTGMRHVVLDDDELTVRFGHSGMAIDLGAAGKGYAIDVAIDRLKEAGITSALLHGGTSSVHAIGAPPGEEAWKIAAPPNAGTRADRGRGGRASTARHRSAARQGPMPTASAPAECHVVRLSDAALSVSAPHGKSFVHDGREYGHVLDPRTGEPVGHTRAACVAGPSSFLCDALSTALLVRGERWAPELARQWPGYEGWTAGP